MGTIEEIAGAAEQSDGAAPLDEATRMALRHRPESVRSWVREGVFALVIEGELTLVVAPQARGRGLGADLLGEVLAQAGGAPLAAWSHGDHPAARALATSTGFARVRELWVMRRPTTTTLPPIPARDDVTIRSYQDDDAADVVGVNAAAFAHHPEQGAMGQAGLAERMAEPWFDPRGLLLAHEGGRLLGFHWTKQHSPDLGEVYVVGIDPAAQGRGLGTLLTLAGLHHLVGLGVRETLLYVEADNAPALAVYGGLGFTHLARDTHVMYRR